MRSSVAPSGSSTRGVRTWMAGSFSSAMKRCNASGPIILVSVGCELKGSASTLSMKGSTWTNDLTCSRSSWLMRHGGCGILHPVQVQQDTSHTLMRVGMQPTLILRESVRGK
jgi:hypothetical protein